MRARTWLVIGCWVAACERAATPASAPQPLEEPAPAELATSSDDGEAPAPPTRQEEEARRRNAIAAHWQGERADVTWHSKREAEIRAAFATARFPSTMVRTLDCRTTLCRIVVEHRDVVDRDAFFSAMGSSRTFAEEFFGYFPGAEAQRDSEIWIAREGHGLPWPPDAG